MLQCTLEASIAATSIQLLQPKANSVKLECTSMMEHLSQVHTDIYARQLTLSTTAEASSSSIQL